MQYAATSLTVHTPCEDAAEKHCAAAAMDAVLVARIAEQADRVATARAMREVNSILRSGTSLLQTKGLACAPGRRTWRASR